MTRDELLDAGERAYHEGDEARAAAFIERARRAGSPTSRLFCDLGVVRAAAGRHEEARASLERALALDPECEAARVSLEALLLHDRERPTETIIIPSHGRPGAVKRLLEALASQSVPADSFEVIVVDDASPQRLDEELHGQVFPFELLVLRLEENSGPGAARNAGVRVARGEFVHFLNDDAIPAPDLIDAHRRAHTRTPEAVAVLGAFPYSVEARRSRFVRLAEECDLIFAMSGLCEGLNDWVYFWTCNISLRREDVVAVGGFDERFRHAMAEDVELGWRLERDRGLAVYYAPDAVCHHDHRVTVDEFVRRQEIMGWNNHMLFEKYGNPTPLFTGWLGPHDERAFARLRESSERDATRHERLHDELRAWDVDDATPLSADELRRARSVAAQLSVTAFRRGVCARHADPSNGKTFVPPEKNFLVGASSEPTPTARAILAPEPQISS